MRSTVVKKLREKFNALTTEESIALRAKYVDLSGQLMSFAGVKNLYARGINIL